ncbi:MAG: hypothetical protein V8Q76_10645 [Bacteroides intestinalis]|nr:hypothetical protein [uncultured Bacteroides sp.]
MEKVAFHHGESCFPSWGKLLSIMGKLSFHHGGKKETPRWKE